MKFVFIFAMQYYCCKPHQNNLPTPLLPPPTPTSITGKISQAASKQLSPRFICPSADGSQLHAFSDLYCAAHCVREHFYLSFDDKKYGNINVIMIGLVRDGNSSIHIIPSYARPLHNIVPSHTRTPHDIILSYTRPPYDIILLIPGHHMIVFSLLTGHHMILYSLIPGHYMILYTLVPGHHMILDSFIPAHHMILYSLIPGHHMISTMWLQLWPSKI